MPDTKLPMRPDAAAPRSAGGGVAPGVGMAGVGGAGGGLSRGVLGAEAAARLADPAGTSLLFLREEQMRLAQDLMFFAYRDFTGAADPILRELGLGRAHHRALHFIGRNPQVPVGDLLGLLRITKQSLARVLGALLEQGHVVQTVGRVDRRQRLLSLTPQGTALERRLFERQRERLAAAYSEAGGPAVEGFRRVMRAVMEPSARSYLDTRERGAAHRS